MKKPLSEDQQRWAFFLDREPSEVARIFEAFRLWIERDVGPLYEWKKAQDKERMKFNVKSAW